MTEVISIIKEATFFIVLFMGICTWFITDAINKRHK